jgi:hypothetical protein
MLTKQSVLVGFALLVCSGRDLRLLLPRRENSARNSRANPARQWDPRLWF